MKSKEHRQELIDFAHRALHGLDESEVFVGVLDNRPMDDARAEFLLQLGHCVLTNKTIIIPVPFGVTVPSKLAAVADRIVRYDPMDMKTLAANLAAAFSEMGINTH